MIRENWWLLILLGLFVGVFVGLFGLGGGVVMVPLLVLLLGYDQRAAQGTSLAVILSPFAAPGIYNWHRGGYIEWRTVWFMAPPLLVGSYFGAKIGQALNQDLMRVIFAVVLTYIAAYMIFSKLDMAKGLAYAVVPVAVTLLLAWYAGVFQVVTHKVPKAAGEPDVAEAIDPVPTTGPAADEVGEVGDVGEAGGGAAHAQKTTRPS